MQIVSAKKSLDNTKHSVAVRTAPPRIRFFITTLLSRLSIVGQKSDWVRARGRGRGWGRGEGGRGTEAPNRLL